MNSTPKHPVNYFSKIKKVNLFHILHYIDYFTLTEISYLNKEFKSWVNSKYQKVILMIRVSLNVYKTSMQIITSQDLSKYLKMNSTFIISDVKPRIRSLITEYFSRLPTMKYFLNKIKKPNTITSLNLQGWDIGKKSMKYLSYYLQGQSSINDINLSENKITMKTLEPLVSNANDLNHIKINNCLLDQGTFEHWSNMNFKQLTCKQSNVENSIISSLKTTRISSLNLSNNLISCKGVLSILRNNPRLTHWNWAKNNITDISMVYICIYFKSQIKQFGRAEWSSINLRENNITTTGLMTLLSCINTLGNYLNKLNLSSNAIDNLPKRIINFSNCKITSLSIGGHHFTWDDWNYIFDFTQKNSTISKLDISNDIWDNVLLHFIFTKILLNTELRHWKWRYCYLGNTEWNDILETYFSNMEIKQKITKLDLSYNFFSNINWVKVKPLINNINYLNWEGNDLNVLGNSIVEFFTIIVNSTNIEELNWNNNYLDNKVKTLFNLLSDAKCPSKLKVLHLEKNWIHDANVEWTTWLANNKMLTKLNLRGNCIGDELGSNYLFKSLTITSLSLLNLKDNQITFVFIKKAFDYFNANTGKLNAEINIKSSKISEEYIKEINETSNSYCEGYKMLLNKIKI